MLSKKGPKEKFYLGNTNLPTAQTEYDYTPAMIKEIAKCRKNIIHLDRKLNCTHSRKEY